MDHQNATQLARKMLTSSTLVETVNINYENFTEDFLTCGTCLCTYDSADHYPKLLHCSHTVCRSCLEKIASLPGVRESGSFRCPHCRESITVPLGGIVTLPPSFLVNQLLDLMRSQRRDIVPKCSTHVQQELLFCETCDQVFCTVCTNGQHSNQQANSPTGCGPCEHTVIPFSIAIKRMSEILLYRAHQCIGKLNGAHENVQKEMQKLDQNSDHAFEDINRTFQEIINLVDRRRQELLGFAKKMREDKRSVLQEQLEQIEKERRQVEEECNGLQYQIEVSNITKKISDLSEKIDSVNSLLEPRENCFVRYEHLHNSAVEEIQRSVNEFGSIRTSKTFPSLCTVSIGKCSAHLRTTAVVQAVDYNGIKQRFGGDPVTADLKHLDDNSSVAVRIQDNRDGTYELLFVPPKGGQYQLKVSIFGRPIKNSLTFEACQDINPLCIYGCRGADTHQFIQPVGLTVGADGRAYILDTGNGRIKVLAQSDCSNSPFEFVAHLTGFGLDNKSATGIALNTEQSSLLVSNWRNRNITELSLNGDFIRHFSHRDFVEPTYLAVNSAGEIIVADNGAKSIFIFHPCGKLSRTIHASNSPTGSNCSTPSYGGTLRKARTPQPSFGVIEALAIGPNDEIVVADSKIQIFGSAGDLQREIYSEGRLRGHYGGISLDGRGHLIATRIEKAKCFLQVFDFASGQLKFTINSSEAKLKRPSGLATTSDFHAIVVDLGNDCIKKFRYY